jgi:hypothetical protein
MASMMGDAGQRNSKLETLLVVKPEMSRSAGKRRLLEICESDRKGYGARADRKLRWDAALKPKV